LRILSCFVNIRTLSITAPVEFDLDDTVVAQLAEAWPNIIILTLKATVTYAPPRITLQSLRSLAQTCPHLKSLHLAFDATTIPAPALCVWSIHVAYSPISSATAVARYLSSLFPNLCDVTTDLEDEDNGDPAEVENDDAQHHLWKQVEDQVPEFVAARTEERAWGAS
ncbi:hypothetical protein FB451DRAFT_1032550, partial [Mycena latifolia]